MHSAIRGRDRKVSRVKHLHISCPRHQQQIPISDLLSSLYLRACGMVALPSIRRSTVDIGRAFELHCLRFLNEQLHMSLTRVGGAGDGGVDLRGWWTVPSSSTSSSDYSASSSRPKKPEPRQRLRVLGQCKAERKALGPRVVRELEGVMAHQRGRSTSSAPS